MALGTRQSSKGRALRHGPVTGASDGDDLPRYAKCRHRPAQHPSLIVLDASFSSPQSQPPLHLAAFSFVFPDCWLYISILTVN